MEGGFWIPSTEKGRAEGAAEPGPKSRHFFRLRSLGVVAIFFLLLRFEMAWAQQDMGPRVDPRDDLEATRLSPFDPAVLRILPGLGHRRALAVRDWARGVWISRREHRRDQRRALAARPKGIGVKQWRILRGYLDLSDLSEEGRGLSKSSRD